MAAQGASIDATALVKAMQAVKKDILAKVVDNEQRSKAVYRAMNEDLELKVQADIGKTKEEIKKSLDEEMQAVDKRLKGYKKIIDRKLEADLFDEEMEELTGMINALMELNTQT